MGADADKLYEYVQNRNREPKPVIPKKIPIPKVLNKFECYFHIYDTDETGNINITLRLNTINDSNTYRWTYSNVNEHKYVDENTFFKPLLDLYGELQHLEYAWESQEDKYINGKYIKGGLLYAMAVFDGGENCREIKRNYGSYMEYIKSL